ncbi:MAG: methylmalonyl-CoA mutase, partial [Candidatus Limnocylindrales bacterium]
MSDRREAWERDRLEPAMGRPPERKPRFSTISDMPIEPMYGPAALSPDAEERIGRPGEAPFTRA